VNFTLAGEQIHLRRRLLRLAHSTHHLPRLYHQLPLAPPAGSVRSSRRCGYGADPTQEARRAPFSTFAIRSVHPSPNVAVGSCSRAGRHHGWPSGSFPAVRFDRAVMLAFGVLLAYTHNTIITIFCQVLFSMRTQIITPIPPKCRRYSHVRDVRMLCVEWTCGQRRINNLRRARCGRFKAL
jgi:hypothetical protein